MKKRIAIVMGTLTLVAIVVALTSAHGHLGQGPRGGNPPAPAGPDMIEHIATMLNLSDDQKTQIKAIHEAARAATEPTMKKLGELHDQLEAATANGQFDEAKVRAIANAQAQLQADLTVEHERAKAKMYSVLTPEQRVKADEMHKHGPHPGFGHPGMAAPPPPAPGELP